MACTLVAAGGPAAHASQLSGQNASQPARTNASQLTGKNATGYDVSYPQCNLALPSGQAFGIVAVNEGLPNNTNTCLADEISWAQLSSGASSSGASSSGASKQPKASLYVNTADPGNHGITDWPVNNTDPLYGYQVWDPYGTCRGGNGQACAWLYGRNMAELDAKTRGVQNPGSYRWWLDVETLNSWEDNNPGNNRADLEGTSSASAPGSGCTPRRSSSSRSPGRSSRAARSTGCRTGSRGPRRSPRRRRTAAWPR
jgi:hypothetical protein